jgi:hypothetical protein
VTFAVNLDLAVGPDRLVVWASEKFRLSREDACCETRKPQAQEDTLMVMAQMSPGKVVVTADGDGVLSHAGSTLLVGLADQIGLTEGLSAAMEPTRERVSAHDPGVVLRDLAVMLVDGGRCLSDLGGQRERASRLGAAVASDSTAYRVISSIDQAGLERLRSAVASARARAWELGGGVRGPVVLDFDATLVGAFSRKQGAAGTSKGGFGHHPLLCYLDGSKEALTGVLRDGNAGSNTAADHMTVGDMALAQLPARALAGEIVARVDGAGATHEFTRWCRDANIAFSVGGAVTQDILTEALIIADEAWQQALCQDNSYQKIPRRGSPS